MCTRKHSPLGTVALHLDKPAAQLGRCLLVPVQLEIARHGGVVAAVLAHQQPKKILLALGLMPRQRHLGRAQRLNLCTLAHTVERVPKAACLCVYASHTQTHTRTHARAHRERERDTHTHRHTHLQLHLQTRSLFLSLSLSLLSLSLSLSLSPSLSLSRARALAPARSLPVP
jgi:hypothetical protein